MREITGVSYETQLDLTGFGFGVSVNRNDFVRHMRSDSSDFDALRVLIQNDMKRLKLQFRTSSHVVSDSNATSICYNFERHEFIVNYTNIRSINLYNNRVYLNLKYPPLLYQIINENDLKEHLQSDQLDGQQQQEEQVEDGGEEVDEYDLAIIDSYCNFDDFDDFGDFDSQSMPQSLPFVNFSGLRKRVNTFNNINAHCFTKTNSICLQFERNEENDTLIEQFVTNIKLFADNIEIIEEEIEYYLFPFAESEFTFSAEKCAHLPFNIKYLMQALDEYSYQFIDSLLLVNRNAFNDFIALLYEYCGQNIEAVEQCLIEILRAVENCLPINPIKELRQSFAKYKNMSTKKWTNNTIKYVRRCILTPTRLLLLPALPLQQSRLLRTCDPEFAIRLLIKDEDFQLLTFTSCKNWLPDDHELTIEITTYLQQTITDRIKDGLKIGGRIYEFLGASTSQLRDHGLIVYARDNQNRNAKQICEAIGELSNISNAAKFISKIGLSMSQSMGYITIPNANCVAKIDDIEGGEHPKSGKAYVFSDGVGMISRSMALKLAKAVNINESIPSTYQIRYAGSKGVLVINPDLNGDVIHLRPSMIKFESNSLNIDILKMSEPRSVFLNRPLITILDDMGVSHEAILQLLHDRLTEISTAFRCNCNAIKLMKSYTNLKIPFKLLLESGINLINEPFFINILKSIICKVTKDLRNKARILIPLTEARIMFGVIDETKTLQYGEVFVQYTDLEDDSKKVLEGEILVTKYPCMHPGDVRKFTAIKVPALMHIVDCIVFPAVGDRPHPDEMAGSDLDGDEYSVIWRKSLIFERLNHKPMDFPCNDPIDLGRAVNTKDILDFYCTFIQKNQVGLIASSHLAWADYNDDGIFSKKCFFLDYKYAVALDFAKTGKNERLKNIDRPLLYPHFMMKNHEKPTYRSSKALGKLFEMNCYFNDVIEEISEQTADNYSPNANLIHENAEIYFDDAFNAFELYKNAIKQLKERFGVESECALLSGSFMKAHKYVYDCNTQNDNDVRDLMSAIVDKLFMDFLSMFECNQTDGQNLLAKASAWYQISYQYNSNAQNTDKYLGFPWIISNYLIKLIDSSDKQNYRCEHKTSQLTLNYKPTNNSLNDITHIIIRALILYSQHEHQFLQNMPNIKRYVQHIMDCNDEISNNNISCNEIILKVLHSLSECNVEWNYEEMKLKIGLIATMTKFRLQRYGNKIEVTLYKAKTQSSNSLTAKSLVISEKLSNAIKAREYEFIAHIKSEIKGIEHILIRYRSKRASVLTVVGTKNAIKKFTFVIGERNLYVHLEENVFLKQKIVMLTPY